MLAVFLNNFDSFSSVSGVSQTVHKVTSKNVVAGQENVPDSVVCTGRHYCCNNSGCSGCGRKALTHNHTRTVLASGQTSHVCSCYNLQSTFL